MPFGPVEYGGNDTLRPGTEHFRRKAEGLIFHVVYRSRQHISFASFFEISRNGNVPLGPIKCGENDTLRFGTGNLRWKREVLTFHAFYRSKRHIFVSGFFENFRNGKVSFGPVKYGEMTPSVSEREISVENGGAHFARVLSVQAPHFRLAIFRNIAGRKCVIRTDRIRG